MTELSAFLKPGKTVHMAGIGGVSMHALAELLLHRGVSVTGSDRSDCPELDSFRKRGVPVQVGHEPNWALKADCVVRTAALLDDNPEIAAARSKGLPVFERGDLLGELMGECDRALCLAGTHGKTTTTAMAARIALEAGLDPTILVGAPVPLLNGCYRIGGRGLMVAEACEYRNSFLRFRPTHAVILNIEADHPDFFTGGLPDIIQSFRAFAALVPEQQGCVLYNWDCPNTRAAVGGLSRRLISFGLEDGADIQAKNLQFPNGFGHFDVWAQGMLYASVTLSVPGRPNVYNALSAAASAWSLDIPGRVVETALSGFRGASRRYEYKGTLNGAQVYDDYAHHPGALRTLLETARTLTSGRVHLVFQPHTYTRTTALFDEFTDALSQADTATLIDVYSAREIPTADSKTSVHLAAAVPGGVLAESFAQAAERVTSLCRPGDMLLIAGAGDVWQVADLLNIQP